MNFIIDDSGSMDEASDIKPDDATAFMQSALQTDAKMQEKIRQNYGKMTRWQEAEDRLHIMIDMLAYIPTDPITLSFLNSHLTMTLDHAGKTPQQFARDAHQSIRRLFSENYPHKATPLVEKLSTTLRNTHARTMHYVMTDGEPSDGSTEMVGDLILKRRNPEMNPITLISCTNGDTDWMKTIEESAPFVSELDDFRNEEKEVRHDQGPVFPFSRGFWIICHLAAAINPDDLDALDESVPFSKMTLDNLMGRVTTEQEYRQYFDNNPNSAKYRHLYDPLSHTQDFAKNIIAGRTASKSYAPLGFSSMFGRSSAPEHKSDEPSYAPPPYTP